MKDVLLDTDFIISFFVSNQSKHKQALRIEKNIKNAELHILNLTLQEAVTVSLRKFTKNLAKDIYDFTNQLSVLHLERDEEDEIYQKILESRSKSTSFIDSANLYIAKQKNLKIVSFDKFYPKNIRIISD